ncbi:XRE family transcriptional regulator [Oryzomonas rubra]|nr:LexA family transcriptional regulator [Oryzomonas rubra]
MQIPQRLKEIRLFMGLTQSEMAQRVGVSNRSWQQYEGGAKPKTDLLMELLKLGFDVNWILSGRGNMLLPTPESNKDGYVAIDVYGGCVRDVSDRLAGLLLFMAVSDCMSPTFQQDEVLLVEPLPGPITENGIYAFVAVNLMVRRIQIMASGDLVLSCDNEKYANEVITSEAFSAFAMIGKVVFVMRRP